MELTIYYGNTGTGKSYAVMERIKENAQKCERSLVIVPGQFTFEYEKKLYKYLGLSLYNSGYVDVLSLDRVKNKIFEVVPPEKEAADNTVKLAVLWHAINTVKENEGFAYYKKQAGKQGFVSTCMDMLTELSHSGVDDEGFLRLIDHAESESRTFCDKLVDIYRVTTEYKKGISGPGLRDTVDDMSLAAKNAEESHFFDDLHIYIDEFKSFTGVQYELIRSMVYLAKDVTVCLTTPDKNLKNAFASVNRTFMYLEDRKSYDYPVKINSELFKGFKRSGSAEIAYMAEKLLVMPMKEYAGGPDGSIHIAKAADIYEECEYICSEIRRLVKKGVRFREITVLSRQMNTDIDILSTYFDRYDIPYFSDKKSPVINTVLARMLIYVMDIIVRPDTQSILSYAKTGLGGLDEEEATSLENYVFEWDIEGSTWELTFPDDNMEQLKEKLLSPIRALRKGFDGVVTGAHIARIMSEFSKERAVILDEMRGRANVTEEEVLRRRQLDSRVTEELTKIFASLESICTWKMTISEFKDIFTVAVRRVNIAAVPTSLDSVAAQQSDLARLSDTKYVFIMHANEGVFPYTPSESKYFTTIEREFFKANGCELSGDTTMQVSEERFNAFKAMCAPSKGLYISYNTSAGKTASPYINRLKKLFPYIKETDISHIPPYEFGMSKKSLYSMAARHGGDTDFGVTAREILSRTDDELRARFEYLDRVNQGYGPEHCIGDRSVNEHMYGDNMFVSSTRFTEYSDCPFKFFTEYGIRLKKRNKRALDMLKWGNATHKCMEVIFKEYDKERFISAKEKELRDRVNDIIDEYLDAEMGDFSRKSDTDIYIQRMKASAVRVLIRMQEELKGSGFVPRLIEEKLGGSESSLCIDIGGHSIIFGGKVDRVDTYKDQYVLVRDYKTGNHPFTVDQILNGRNVQMFLYLYELIRDGGKLAGMKPAGVLYVPIVSAAAELDSLTDDADIEAKMDSNLKMAGLLVNDKEVLDAMEKIPAGGKGRFIPVSYTNNGTVNGNCKSVVETEKFEEIREEILTQLRSMGEKLYNGDIPASPLEESGSIACEKCDYSDFCVNFDTDEICRKWRKVEKGKASFEE